MPATYDPKLRDLVLSLLNTDSSKRPDALEILHVLFKIQGKRFSSEPLQPMSVDAFDQKQICHAVKTFELSSESHTILPLRTWADGSHKESKLAESFTDDEPDSRSTTASNESYNQQRPLPVPKARKKKNPLKTLANSNNRQKKDDDTETDVFDYHNQSPDDRRDNKDSFIRHRSQNSTTSSQFQHSYLSDEEFASPDSSHSNSNEWTQQYLDNLAKDSIKWLKERFKPNDNDTQMPASESPDEEESDDEDEEVAGLITLFTQSQIAVYIHRQSRMADDATDENLQKKVMVDDMSESVIEAARKTIDVFQGQDPHLLKLMLIKIMGLRGFALYGQSMLDKFFSPAVDTP